MSVTISAVQQQGLFDNIRKIKELLEQLSGLGIDFSKLGELGKLVMDAIKVIRDAAKTAAEKVNAVITMFEKLAAATTGIAWDDKLAAALRSIEPLIVKLIGAIGIKEDGGATVSAASASASANAAVEVASESGVLAFDPMTLFAIAKMVWDVIMLFLKKKPA